MGWRWRYGPDGKRGEERREGERKERGTYIYTLLHNTSTDSALHSLLTCKHISSSISLSVSFFILSLILPSPSTHSLPRHSRHPTHHHDISSLHQTNIEKSLLLYQQLTSLSHHHPSVWASACDQHHHSYHSYPNTATHMHPSFSLIFLHAFLPLSVPPLLSSSSLCYRVSSACSVWYYSLFIRCICLSWPIVPGLMWLGREWGLLLTDEGES